MKIDFDNVVRDLQNGTFRIQLEEQLLSGFRQLRAAGERLPPASHYAARIATIVDSSVPEPLSGDEKFHLYQEILEAVESASRNAAGEDSPRA